MEVPTRFGPCNDQAIENLNESADSKSTKTSIKVAVKTLREFI